MLDSLCMASTARATAKHSQSLLDMMRSLRSERNAIAVKEMKMVMNEHDNVVHQVLCIHMSYNSCW